MARLPTNYNKLEDLPTIEPDDLLNIELLARVLSVQECFEYLLLEESELTAEELAICNKVHRRGLKRGIHEATQALFSQMKSRGGTDACLNYLKTFAGQFTVETEPGGAAAAGFNFSVTLTEDQKKPDEAA